MKILSEVSLGELVDKITILELKSKYIDDTKKLEHVKSELKTLGSTLSSLELAESLLAQYKDELHDVNEKLWHIEDDLRNKEARKEFNDEFVELARSVYFTNDKRAEIKKKINVQFGSDLVEEKSYQKY